MVAQDIPIGLYNAPALLKSEGSHFEFIQDGHRYIGAPSGPFFDACSKRFPDAKDDLVCFFDLRREAFNQEDAFKRLRRACPTVPLISEALRQNDHDRCYGVGPQGSLIPSVIGHRLDPELWPDLPAAAVPPAPDMRAGQWSAWIPPLADLPLNQYGPAER
jgi:hypothetical protein